MKTENIKHWLYGLLAAAIGGGAGAVTSAISASLIKPEAFNLGGQLKPTIDLMMACFLLNGLVSMFFYLKQSPLPKNDDDEKVI